MDELDEIYPFVAAMTPAGRARLIGQARWHGAQPQQILVRRGDPVSAVYLVASGALRVFHSTSEGRESTLYWVGRGESCILAMNFPSARIPPG